MLFSNLYFKYILPKRLKTTKSDRCFSSQDDSADSDDDSEY